MATAYYYDLDTGKVVTRDDTKGGDFKPLTENIKYGTTTITPTTKVSYSRPRSRNVATVTQPVVVEQPTTATSVPTQKEKEQQRLSAIPTGQSYAGTSALFITGQDIGRGSQEVFVTDTSQLRKARISDRRSPAPKLKTSNIKFNEEDLQQAEKFNLFKPFTYAGEKLLATSEFFISKVDPQGKLPFSDVKVPRSEARNIVTSTLIFGAFSPLTQTTGQIRSQLPKETKVIFKGVEQTRQEGLVRTDVRYITSQKDFGTATGYTELQTPAQSKTFFFGKVGDRARQFFGTSGTVSKQEKAIFSLNEFAGMQKDVTISGTIGRTVTSRAGKPLFRTALELPTGRLKTILTSSRQPFISQGISISQDKGAFAFGKTIVPSRDVTYSAGIIQRATKPDSFSSFVKGTGSPLISKKAFQDVATGVKSAVTVKPATMGVSPYIPSATTQRASGITYQTISRVPVPTIETTKTETISGIIQDTTPRTSQGITPIVTGITRTKQRPIEVTTPVQPLVTGTQVNLGFKQPQIPIVSSKLTTVTPRTGIPFTPPVSTATPFFAFPALSFRGDGLTRLRSLKASRTYSYFPSFKAITFNIRRKGKAPSGKTRFTGLELRPIFNGF